MQSRFRSPSSARIVTTASSTSSTGMGSPRGSLSSASKDRLSRTAMTPLLAVGRNTNPGLGRTVIRASTPEPVGPGCDPVDTQPNRTRFSSGLRRQLVVRPVLLRKGPSETEMSTACSAKNKVKLKAPNPVPSGIPATVSAMTKSPPPTNRLGVRGSFDRMIGLGAKAACPATSLPPSSHTRAPVNTIRAPAATRVCAPPRWP